jgi:hypothetical protein
MKKCMLGALVLIVTFLVCGGACLAQTDRTVTNTSKKGSLLIWPLIKVGSADTIIKLNNEYYDPVKVKCFYRSSFPFANVNWTFTLLPNQPISWYASTGKGVDGKTIPGVRGSPPALTSGTVAEMRCWAVDNSVTQQIAWNWLTGDAIIKEGSNQQWGYSAWRFAVNSSTTGATAGTAGKLQLTGDSGNYDACPTALLFNFMKQNQTASGNFTKGLANNVLTLVPCPEDFATNTAPVVYASMVTQDELQSTLPGAYACVGSADATTQWFSESLISTKLNIIDSTSNPFTSIASPGGNIYIHGRSYSGRLNSCLGSSGVPLIGVMSTQYFSPTGVFTGGAPTNIGPGQGYVKDSSDAYTSAPIAIYWYHN